MLGFSPQIFKNAVVVVVEKDETEMMAGQTVQRETGEERTYVQSQVCQLNIEIVLFAPHRQTN